MDNFICFSDRVNHYLRILKKEEVYMKENTEERIWMLVTRYLSNETDETEKLELERWLNEDELHRKEFEHFENIWKLSSQKEADLFDDTKAWNKLHKKLTINKDEKNHSQKFMLVSALRMAAAILFLMALAFAVRYIISGPKLITVTAEQKMVTKPVVLPDGSEVFLNAGSSLKFPKKFNKSARNVELTGEAFFTVKRNEQMPFIIKSNRAQVKVLGTSFNVLSYPNSDSIQVAVETGIVELSSQSGAEKIMLTKGNSGAYYFSVNKITQSQNDINSFAWMTNRIVFRESNLDYVTKTLERIFKKKIDIKEKELIKCKLTADFKDLELSKILEAIKTSLNLEIEESSECYNISGKGC
jgi:ferric-dicitrate binding protein FerR (iron transport regulator)